MKTSHPLSWTGWCFVLSAFMVAVMTVLPFWKIWPAMQGRDGFVALHFHVIYGVDLVGPFWRLFFLPAIGSVLLFGNAAFRRVLGAHHGFLRSWFANVTLVSEGILLAAMGFLVFVNQ